MNTEELIDYLKSAGVGMAPGLTSEEMAGLEEEHGFRFPPDLASLLLLAVPIGEFWPEWRNREDIEDRMKIPMEGILFDVEHSRVWREEWGIRPGGMKKALQVASQHIAKAPKLIPVFSHRYLPAVPALAGNPVFSVHQTDIILYGADLEEYFRNEFPASDGPLEFNVGATSRSIDFWSDLVS